MPIAVEVAAEIRGDKKTRRELRRLEKRHPEAVAAAMFEEALIIFEESQNQTPVDTGTLRRSGIVFLSRSGRDFEVIIGYGTNYALRVHEDESADVGRRRRAELELSNPGVYKPRGSTVGKSKFLSDPFDDAIAGIQRRIVVRTRGRLRRRGNLLSEVRTVRGSGKSGG